MQAATPELYSYDTPYANQITEHCLMQYHNSHTSLSMKELKKKEKKDTASRTGVLTVQIMHVIWVKLILSSAL